MQPPPAQRAPSSSPSFFLSFLIYFTPRLSAFSTVGLYRRSHLFGVPFVEPADLLFPLPLNIPPAAATGFASALSRGSNRSNDWFVLAQSRPCSNCALLETLEQTETISTGIVIRLLALERSIVFQLSWRKYPSADGTSWRVFSRSIF